MAGRVEGKVAFITGAARGQGRSHAVRLAEEGADIIAIDICGPIRPGTETAIPASTPEDLAETADLVKNLGRRIVTAEVDVRDFPGVKEAVDSGVEQLGRLDIVVANAGIGNGGDVLHETSQLDWDEMIDTNLSGVWKSVKAAVPHIISGGNGGSIVLTSSVGGLKAYPHCGNYVAAKHGVVGLMRTYANLLAQFNIRVNSIHPAGVNTPMIDNDFIRSWLEGIAQETQGGPDMGNALPVQTLEPEDIANAVFYLVSDTGRYVTGVALPVDAGYVNKR